MAKEGQPCMLRGRGMSETWSRWVEERRQEMKKAWGMREYE
jgi:hypothetical protein